jgi:hypothetical protein
MNAECPLCGRHATRRHHITGKGPDGSYLDPDALVRTCHDDHMLAHDDWNTVVPVDATADDTFLGSLERRMTRAATFVGRVAEVAPEPFRWVLAVLAALLASWAARLAGSLAVLDQYSPGWRALPGV